MKITKEITIEELVENLPSSVKYLMDEGIKCIACGEPIWGTLEEAAKEKNFDNSAIEQFVTDLNKLSENKNDTKDEQTKSINVNKLDI